MKWQNFRLSVIIGTALATVWSAPKLAYSMLHIMFLIGVIGAFVFLLLTFWDWIRETKN